MSPIRSSAAAGSSHALGDNRFAKTVSEVSATRTEGRKTALSGVIATTATMAATPTIGNYLVVMLSSNNAGVVPTCSYSGVSGTLVNSNLTTGICAGVYYIPVSSVSSGTTLNIAAASGPTIIGYSVTEVSGVYAASPVDVSGTAVGSCSSSSSLTVLGAGGGHTYIGSRCFAFVSLAGAQTDAGAFNSTDMTSGTTWGNYAAADDILGRTFGPATSYSAAGGIIALFGTATARNGVGIYVSFRPAA